ncbi:hypothetical protein GCM10027284_47440 [Cyclobacterium sediminis]
MVEARMVNSDIPQNTKAKIEVSTKVTGIVNLAGIRKPTNITEATKIGKTARKNNKV